MKLNPIKLIKGDSRLAEIIRFGIVGGIATLLQYGFYLLFVDIAGIPAVASTMLSYILSLIANFFLSSFFTFRSRPNTKKGLGFLSSHLINMGMQTGLVALFKGLVGDSLALLPAMAICIPINYLLIHFVFTSRFFSSENKQSK